MTSIDGHLKKYKEILEQKQAELLVKGGRRDEIAIEQTPDQIDEIQRASERELAIRALDREAKLLRSVRGALRRIEEGTFGICVHCEEEISPRRLSAVPWAALCLECQEAADNNHAETLDSLMDAA